MKRISTVEKCEKNFWMHGVSVVTKCPECNFHFGVSAGYQFKGGKLVPVECSRYHKK